MKVGSMSRGKRILLVTSMLLLCANGLSAGLFRRKAKTVANTSPAVAMALTAIEAAASHVTLHTSGTPAYTSYSPSPDVFVIDLTGTSRPSDLAIPASLPAGINTVSAEEVVEMGNRLTRVTFRLGLPMLLKAEAGENTITINLPEPAVASAPITAPAPVEAVPAPAPEPVVVAETPAVEMAAPVAPQADLPKAKTVRKIETTGAGENLEVVIAGDGAMTYRAFRLDNPSRLVIDLDGVRNKVARPALAVDDSLVQKVRVAQFKSTPAPVTRVVVDLSGKSEFAVTQDGERLLVTFGAQAAMRKTAAPVMAATTINVAEPAKTEPPKPAATVEEIPTVADNANTWKMPSSTEGARQVINSPQDQAPPTRPVPVTPTPAPVTPQPTPPLAGENVFDDTQPNRVAASPGGRVLSGSQRTFTGDPISLSLKDADIKDVIRTFAELTGLNIAVDPEVRGSVTVDFVDVPWDQALDLILRQNNLTFVLEGNVMRVGFITRLAAEAEAQQELQEKERLNVPLTTLSFKLSYARAEDVSNLLRSIASPRARIIVDARTNQLIISEVPQYLSTMRNLIDTVDVPNRQVTIEARIVETTKIFQLQYGFRWSFGGVLDPALGNGTGLVFPNRIGFNGGPFSFTAAAPTQIISLTLLDVLGTFDLDLALAAHETEQLLRVISAPKVTTQDNTSATIQSGVQIPFQTRVNFTTTVSFISATLNLLVTPQITEAGTIIMDISINKTTPGDPIPGVEGAPLNTRSASTRVMVRDGGTAVIGGIYQAQDSASQTRVPVLHQIPIIGALFRSNTKRTQHDELLIFITPRIVRGT